MRLVTNEDIYLVSISKLSDGSEESDNVIFTISLSTPNTTNSNITGSLSYNGSATEGVDYITPIKTYFIAKNANAL